VEKISITWDRLTLNDQTQAVVLEIEGRIDATTSLHLEDELKKLLKEHFLYIGLNLEELKYINSTGMGLLLQYAEQFIDKGGCFCLIAIPKKIRTLFDMLGIMAVFKVLENKAEFQTTLQKLLDEKNQTTPTPTPNTITITTSQKSEEKENDTFSQYFPIVLACIGCNGNLTISRPGYFRCARCYYCLHIGEDGQKKEHFVPSTPMMHLNLPCKMNAMRGIYDLVVQFLEAYDIAENQMTAISKSFEELSIILQEKTFNWGDNFDLLIASSSTEFRALLKTPFPLFTQFGEEKNNINFQIIQNIMDAVELLPAGQGTQILTMMKKLG
jgi:anti-anti-sigma factor